MFFHWAGQHDVGDQAKPPYPIAVHGILGFLVLAALTVAWRRRKNGIFHILHLLPLAVGAGYAALVLYFVVMSAHALLF
ncbi:MAG TPA: hypothetical protein VGC54_08660 [Planctomycetota bacterium]